MLLILSIKLLVVVTFLLGLTPGSLAVCPLTLPTHQDLIVGNSPFRV